MSRANPPPPERSAPPLLPRCNWAVKPLDIEYHDREWGVPVRDDRVLFEFLILEGAQAGLSWSTILAKRENYRRAFDGFDPARIARYDARKKARLMADAGIVRNRLKIESAVTNARAFLALQKEHGRFSDFLWSFVDGRPVQNMLRSVTEVPARSALSDKISSELSTRGFKFVGSTIVYAYLQAMGVVNDHLTTCHRHAALARGSKA